MVSGAGQLESKAKEATTEAWEVEALVTDEMEILVGVKILMM